MLLSIMLALSAAEPPRDPKMEAVMAFSSSLEHPMQVKTCRKLLPDRKKEFKEAQATWNEANASLVSQGREIIREEGLRSRTNTFGMLEYMKARQHEAFQAKPKDEQVAGCIALLAELKPRS